MSERTEPNGDAQPHDTISEILARRRQRPDLVAGADVLAIVPRNIDEVLRVADIVLLANIVPDNLCKEGGKQLSSNEVVSRVVAVIMAGSEVGMGPMASLANIAIINKRRSIWGQGAVALLQKSTVLEDMKVERVGTQPAANALTGAFPDDFGIKVTLKRRGQEEPYVGEYTVGMAKRAHLWMNGNKKPWIESPERQLQWRAFHFAATDGFADCLMGMMIREVAIDLPSEVVTKPESGILDDEPPSLPAPTEQPMEGISVPETNESQHAVAQRRGPSSSGQDTGIATELQPENPETGVRVPPDSDTQPSSPREAATTGDVARDARLDDGESASREESGTEIRDEVAGATPIPELQRRGERSWDWNNWAAEIERIVATLQIVAAVQEFRARLMHERNFQSLRVANRNLYQLVLDALADRERELSAA